MVQTFTKSALLE